MAASLTIAEQFLAMLWSAAPPGYIQTWELRGRKSRYSRTPSAAAYYVSDGIDVYIGVGLAHTRHGVHQRARSDQVIAIPGMWLDIDVDGGPEGKRGACPSKEAAIRFASSVLRPTALVDSGYGIHAWHLFEAPWRFRSREEQAEGASLARRWWALHAARARELGWKLDATHDLARLMRCPGSYNGKGGGRAAVQWIERERADLYVDELRELLADVPEPQQQAPVGGEGRASELLPVVDVQAGVPLDPAVLDVLMEEVDDFRRTWNHERDPGWSMSEYDLSLASLCANGWNDQQLASLIVSHRLHYNPNDPKAHRADYLRMTVARARMRDDRSRAADAMVSMAASARERWRRRQ